MIGRLVAGKHVGGRRRPKHRERIHLRDYFTPALPPPPASCDYSTAAMASLGLIYLNDQLGDCVIAGACHLRGVTSGNAGDCVTFTDGQVTALYSAIGGYVPGDESTDQGCDESTAIQYLTQTGYPDGVKLAGSAGVTGTNQVQVRQAIYMFESVVFGIELPQAWVDNMPQASGFVWDVAGDPCPENGHCVIGVGYTADGVIISTWGMLGLITWAAVSKYCNPFSNGEIHVALSPDAIVRASGRAPNGFNFFNLQSDLASFLA